MSDIDLLCFESAGHSRGPRLSVGILWYFTHWVKSLVTISWRGDSQKLISHVMVTKSELTHIRSSLVPTSILLSGSKPVTLPNRSQAKNVGNHWSVLCMCFFRRTVHTVHCSGLVCFVFLFPFFRKVGCKCVATDNMTFATCSKLLWHTQLQSDGMSFEDWAINLIRVQIVLW